MNLVVFQSRFFLTGQLDSFSPSFTGCGVGRVYQATIVERAQFCQVLPCGAGVRARRSVGRYVENERL